MNYLDDYISSWHNADSGGGCVSPRWVPTLRGPSRLRRRLMTAKSLSSPNGPSTCQKGNDDLSLETPQSPVEGEFA